MGWKDLLSAEGETICLPWTGGRSLRSRNQTWTIKGRLPNEHGWYEFSLDRRQAQVKEPCEPSLAVLDFKQSGYLVGDRFLSYSANPDPDPTNIAAQSERVHLISDDLERFAVAIVGRVYEDGPLIYIGEGFPFGPEEEVLTAFLDQKEDVLLIKNVVPALDAVFRMETWQRKEAERRRIELEHLRREEEERLAREERRRELVEKMGDGAGRRAMAAVDFTEAARAALAVGGAELLDVRSSRQGEKIVKYRLDGRRFECICDLNLRIVSSGVCLTDHHTGVSGDAWLTLESLPGVILEAIRENKLVVYRHV